MSRSRWLPILLALAVLALASLACGSSDQSGTKVGSTGGDASPTQAAKTATYKIGDVVKVGKHTIVLNSAKVSQNTLIANFTVENQGSKEFTVSSLLSFEAKDAEGTKLDLDIVHCSNMIDGAVDGFDKRKGNICWDAATVPARIYYRADMLGEGAVIWQLQ